MKLIHSGKVLKDDDAVSACGIKPNDFLVAMITKAKKPAVAAAAPKPATPDKPKEDAKPSSTSETAATPAPAAAAGDASSSTAAPPAPSRPDDLPAEAVENLTAMGFPEAEVRHCLRAARGNPDIAVEFLTNGIPDSVSQAAAMDTSTGGNRASSSPAAGSSGSGQPLQALRRHPQFNDLRRLVQSNPQMLQQVLTQIGQQQPELLEEINANQALFLQMMNEPVDASSPSGSGSSGAGASRSSPSGGAPPGGLGAGAGGLLGDPSQMAQMIQNMSAEEVGQMAAMMGLSPDQLRQTAEMIGQLPPEQLNQFMMQAMGGGGGDFGGMMGGGGGGAQVLRLSEEEMAAVDRLTEMGFDRAEAAQAFLACDKNEALAANLLMDSMGDGGFGFGGDSSGGGGGDGSGDGGNGDGNNNDDDDEEMYD